MGKSSRSRRRRIVVTETQEANCWQVVGKLVEQSEKIDLTGEEGHDTIRQGE